MPAQEYIMRKLLVVALVLIAAVPAFSQTTKEKQKKEILSRAGDHFMIQLASDQWLNAPDSIKDHIKGLSRGLNVYVMLDKPFRADPRFSVAFGLGVGTSNIYFKKMNVDITSNQLALPFIATDTTQHFKKFKLSTAFLEVPLEVRFSANPERPNKSVKIALGVKLGTLLNAHTKGKILQDASDKTLINYTEKKTDKSYFNSTRLAATARIGYGNFSLFGAYNITAMFKDAVAADVKLLQVGLTLSGL